MTRQYSNSPDTLVTKPIRPSRDLTGQKFGHWTVVRFSDADTKKRKRYWICLCDCGAERRVEGYQLTAGHSQSCGCFRVERRSASLITHGMTKNPAIKSWYSMISRCYNPDDSSFYRYGHRGITVCDRWRFGENGLHGAQCFLADMGERPKGHTIDRKDTNGNYEPSNCRWATPYEQVNNRNYTLRYEFDGQIMSLSDWGKHLGLNSRLLSNRLRAGWTVERAFTSPVGKMS